MRHLDRASLIVIVITFALFVTALFTKGLTHDLLLEAGVFLVSVKLIIGAYKHDVEYRELLDRLDHMQDALTRLERTANAEKASTN